MLVVRKATVEDVPRILSLIRELAAYEKEPHQVIATEEDLRRDGFPAEGEPAFRVMMVEEGGSGSGSGSGGGGGEENRQQATGNRQQAMRDAREARRSQPAAFARSANAPPARSAWEGGRLTRGAREGGPRPPQEAIGFAFYFFTYSTWNGRRCLYLEDLFVEPEHRGKGAGLALMSALAREAIEARCMRFVWSVLDWNTPSIEFYERLGAKVMREWLTVRLEGEALEALARRAGR